MDKYKLYNAYKYSFKKLKEAIEFEFYFEAILIEYAIIEDRIYSLLRKIGFSNENNNISESRLILFRKLTNSPNSRWIDLNKRIDFINFFSRNNNFDLTSLNESQFILEKEIRNKLIRVSFEIQPLMFRLSKWAKLRNNIVHKFIHIINSELTPLAKNLSLEGFQIIRLLDKVIRKL